MTTYKSSVTVGLIFAYLFLTSSTLIWGPVSVWGGGVMVVAGTLMALLLKGNDTPRRQPFGFNDAEGNITLVTDVKEIVAMEAMPGPEQSGTWLVKTTFRNNPVPLTIVFQEEKVALAFVAKYGECLKNDW